MQEKTVHNLSVCISPALLPLYELEGRIVVMIDIFRASSSICYGIANGATAIIPVSEIEECYPYRNQGILLAAERNGVVVQGFDFGNSPFSYTKEKVDGKTIVLTTTNGTRAIKRSLNACKIIVGSFLNLSAVCDWLLEQEEDIILLCAGWKENFCLEDMLFAGAVVEKLNGCGRIADDGATAAEDLYKLAKDDLVGYLAKSSHSERLRSLHIEKDISFCLQLDLFNEIPILKGNKLVKFSKDLQLEY